MDNYRELRMNIVPYSDYAILEQHNLQNAGQMFGNDSGETNQTPNNTSSS